MRHVIKHKNSSLSLSLVFTDAHNGFVSFIKGASASLYSLTTCCHTCPHLLLHIKYKHSRTPFLCNRLTFSLKGSTEKCGYLEKEISDYAKFSIGIIWSLKIGGLFPIRRDM